MKGYTIQHSIDILEDQVEDLQNTPSGGSTAADITYDNTSSGLTADDVQEAIDELKGDIPGLDQYGLIISTTERKVGKWFDDDLYAKTFDIPALASSATSTSYPHGITDSIKTFKASAIDASGVVIPLPFYSTANNYNIGISVNTTNVMIETQRDSSGYHAYITLYYTKATAASNTRSKKAKKEE